MPPSREGSLRRFSPGERMVHLSLATLFGVCIATAAALYLDPVSALVGHRDLLAGVHYVSGLLLPVPLVVGFLCSVALRRDSGELNRFHRHDWKWLRSSDRRSGAIPVGKFNAGQKLNAAFTLGAVLVLFGTGLMLHYFAAFPDDIRTGATFVHDLVAAAVVVVSAGHVWMAARDPVARAGLRSGWVPADWAAHEHGLWLQQESALLGERERDGGG